MVESWALVMVSVAISFILAFPALGLYLYSPRRARHVKLAESDVHLSTQVAYLRARHPEYVRVYRLDRAFHYVGLHVAALGYAACIFAGAPVTSNVQSLGPGMRNLLAGCFLLGSVLALTGAAMGGRVAGVYFRRSVSDHPVAPVLGDDVQLPYTFGIAAMVSMSISLGIYASTSFKSTTGSLGGWMTLVFAAVSATQLVAFVVKIRAFSRDRARFETEALAAHAD